MRQGRRNFSDSTLRRSGRFVSTVGTACLLASALIGLCGCNWNKAYVAPFSQPKCELPPNPTVSEVLAHVNANVDRMQSWHSTEVVIKMSGPLGLMPFKPKATITVEKPRNLRLLVSSPANQIADMGSNQDRFWFWTGLAQGRQILTARHDQCDSVRHRFNVPFEPSWLMEALGVVRIREDSITHHQLSPESKLFSLVSEQAGPDGRPVRRVILVDPCNGFIVAHELYDAANTLVARAELNDYKLDKETGVHLPHEINLDVPGQRMAMTLKIGEIDVNPNHLPSSLFKLPSYPDCPYVDLAQVRPRGAAAPSARPPSPGAGRRRAPRRGFVQPVGRVWVNSGGSGRKLRADSNNVFAENPQSTPVDPGGSDLPIWAHADGHAGGTDDEAVPDWVDRPGASTGSNRDVEPNWDAEAMPVITPRQ